MSEHLGPWTAGDEAGAVRDELRARVAAVAEILHGLEAAVAALEAVVDRLAGEAPPA